MKKEGLTILSLFDGISCGYLALEKANIKIKKYYSSEIEKNALQLQSQHYSGNTSFCPIGDVKKINGADYAHVQLIIGGSPCINLSSINPKDRSGLDGEHSSLFYEFVRIIKEILAVKPKGEKLYVLLENVASMANSEKEKISIAISEALGEDVRPIKINSAILAPANRRRLYWSNIKGIKMPTPVEAKYQNIVENGYVDREKANVLLSSNVTNTMGIFRYYKMNLGNIIFKKKNFADLPTKEKLELYPAILKASGHKGKARAVPNEYEFPNGCYRLPSVLECERLMTMPDGYVSGVPNISKTEKHKLIGLSFTVDVVAHLLGQLKNVSHSH